MDAIFKQLGAGIRFDPKVNKLPADAFQPTPPKSVPSNAVAKKPERLDFFDSKKRKREIPTEGTKKKIIEEPKAKKPRAESNSADVSAESAGEDAGVSFSEARVKIEGSDVPEPLESWEDSSIPSYLAQAILAAGYKNPSPVQAHVIPSFVSGREVLVAAPTGSGKTAAYCIPLLMVLKKPKPQSGIRSLLVLPTRELALQVEAELRKLCGSKPFRITVLTSGVSLDPNAPLHADILLTTPKRLQALLSSNQASLAAAEYLVLDESDKLLSDEFLRQMDDVLASLTHENRKVHMLSATMMPHVEELSKSVMKDPVRILVGAKNAVVSTIEQKLVYCGNEKGKLMALRQHILSGVRAPALIFVQSKERAEELYRELLFDNLSVDLLTGARSVAQREKTIELFRAGKVHFLIATNLLSRGLDFTGVNLVINYDLPTSPVDYIHRVGRTGRMGKLGVAHTYYTDEDIPQLRQIVNVIKQSGQPVPPHLLDIKLLSSAERAQLAKKPVQRSRVGTDSLEQEKEMAAMQEEWARRSGKKIKKKPQQNMGSKNGGNFRKGNKPQKVNKTAPNKSPNAFKPKLNKANSVKGESKNKPKSGDKVKTAAKPGKKPRED